jgi:hypothetical protein
MIFVGCQGRYLIEDYSNRSITYFASDFGQQASAVRRLPYCAEAIQEKLSCPFFSGGDVQFHLRDPEKRFFAIVTPNRIVFQTLGSPFWIENKSKAIGAIQAGVVAMEAKEMRRTGFRTLTFIPLKMAHAEMCDLMLGSYYLPREDLEADFGKIVDVATNLHVEYNGLKARIQVMPQTADDALVTVRGTPNLEMFLEPRFADLWVKEFEDRVNHDGCMVDIDISRLNHPADNVATVIQTALTGADDLSGVAIRRLRG